MSESVHIKVEEELKKNLSRSIERRIERKEDIESRKKIRAILSYCYCLFFKNTLSCVRKYIIYVSQ